jgi:hypothetical protein
MSARTTLLAGLLLCAVACGGKTAAEHADAAQAALNSGEYAAARSAAEAALKDEAVKADKGLAWRLEKVRLDALAGQKDEDEMLASLGRLGTTNAAQVDAPLYGSLSISLNDAGDIDGAIDVLEAGKQKFPEHTDKFETAKNRIVAAAKKAAEEGNSAELERLKALGYV